MNRILVIEDDDSARVTVGQILEDEGYGVGLAASGEEGLADLARHPDTALVLTDVVMPGMDGYEVLRRIRESHPGVLVIVMTAFASVQKAVSAMKRGAVDYLEKPLDLGDLRDTVARALENRPRLVESRAPAAGEEPLEGIIGTSPAMREIFATIRQVAPSRATVLLEGESGTGKELLANAVHTHSLRSRGPLVAVHCASLAETLIESELFGHVRGAFTGAISDRTGHFEAASGGTLFLDEISEIPPTIQAKLLRVLQEREVIRVGATQPRKIDVRLVAATNKDLKQEVAEGRFREDLFYRVHVVAIRVPPLRERREDIPALAEHFVQAAARENERAVRAIAPEALHILEQYDWPGNVRELQNALENAVVLARGDTVTPELLPLDVRVAAHGLPESAAGITSGDEGVSIRVPLGTPLEEVEKELILRTLESVGGNKTQAARILGIGARTLYRKLEQYGVHTPTREEEEQAPDEAG